MVHYQVFFFKPGHSAMESFAKFQQIYGDSVSSRVPVFQWLKASLEGRKSTEDKPCSRRPSSLKTNENLDRIWDIYIQSVDKQKKLNLTHTTFHQPLTKELGMRKVYAQNGSNILASKNILVAHQPSYLHDLSPCDFSS